MMMMKMMMKMKERTFFCKEKEKRKALRPWEMKEQQKKAISHTIMVSPKMHTSSSESLGQ